METLQELFVEQLKDVHNAEKQLTKALPKMAKAAKSPALRAAFETHLAQTKVHAERLESVFAMLGEKVGRKKCAAMEGLIEEGSELIAEKPVPEVMDAGLIAAAQRVEHYEMAAYGTLSAFAKALGHMDALKVFQATLKEEVETDTLLTNLAETEVNPKALSPGKAPAPAPSKKPRASAESTPTPAPKPKAARKAAKV